MTSYSKSNAVDHSLASDHYCILTQLNISSPPRRQLCVEARNVTSVDVVAFKADLHSRLQSSSPMTAEQLHQLLVHLLDQHAPATRCKVSNRPPHLGTLLLGLSLWRLNVNDAGPREGGWRLVCMFTSNVFQSVNAFVNKLGQRAKTSFYNAKILADTTSKQFFNIANTLLGKSKAFPLPSSIPPSEIP